MWSATVSRNLEYMWGGCLGVKKWMHVHAGTSVLSQSTTHPPTRKKSMVCRSPWSDEVVPNDVVQTSELVVSQGAISNVALVAQELPCTVELKMTSRNRGIYHAMWQRCMGYYTTTQQCHATAWWLLARL